MLEGALRHWNAPRTVEKGKTGEEALMLEGALRQTTDLVVPVLGTLG